MGDTIKTEHQGMHAAAFPGEPDSAKWRRVLGTKGKSIGQFERLGGDEAAFVVVNKGLDPDTIEAVRRDLAATERSGA